MHRDNIRLLFVDDQKSVREGMAAGVHFRDCGISLLHRNKCRKCCLTNKEHNENGYCNLKFPHLCLLSKIHSTI